MKLILEPTEHFFMAGDVMVRLWTGTDGDDNPVDALISGVLVHGGSPPPGLISIPGPDKAEQERWAHAIIWGRDP